MVPALLGAGFILSSVGKIKANQDQAKAEEQNASYYREQADYAQAVGDRQRKVFEDESDLLYSEQQSAFAKAGVDLSSSAYFLAQTMSSRQIELYAIEKETASNVRLAQLRAERSEQTAQDLKNPAYQVMSIAGSGIQTFGALG